MHVGILYNLLGLLLRLTEPERSSGQRRPCEQVRVWIQSMNECLQLHWAAAALPEPTHSQMHTAVTCDTAQEMPFLSVQYVKLLQNMDTPS